MPGCGALTQDTYCPTHKRVHKRRPAVYHALYGSTAYRRARDAFMAAHQVCAICGAPATDLDHINPHRGDLKLFWDTDNWQPLCASCHSRKTAREDGGYGNGRRLARD